MTRVQNFVETENFLKMEEIINRTRAVLVDRLPHKTGSIHMTLSMSVQEKRELLKQITA
jgi:hypothetical protein